MEPLNATQRSRFKQELKCLYQTDATHQFLSQCVEGTSTAHKEQLVGTAQDTFYTYMQAACVLQRHKAYLAYRLGLQHGKEL